MREFLFRGKRVDTGRWIEGSLWYYLGVPKILSAANVVGYDVHPDSVGQFVGLTDKNGKKIFEWDVIKFHKFRGEPDWVGVISYEHSQYVVTGRMPVAYEKRIGEEPFYCPFEVSLSGIDKDTIRVIGNTHDTPELVRRSEDA